MDEFVVIFIFIIAVLIYILPALGAALDNHPHTTAITILNLFLGWTFLGWLAALIWAVINPKKKKIETVNAEKKENTFDDLEKLAELKEKGIITKEEFDKKKVQILGL